MADPTQDVPPDGPLGQRDSDLKFRALGLGVTGAARIGAVVELADQLHRTLEGVEATVSVITDIHHASAGRAIAIEDIEFPEGEIRILRPGVRHPANLQGVARSIGVASKAKLTHGKAYLLAFLRTVVFR
jgi:hypothetical protein